MHPGAAPGVGNQWLWKAATAGCNEYTNMGRYLHYLQDTFSHEGFPDPKCGHGCTAQHLPDHTSADPEKTLAAAKATWNALNEYAKIVKCGCQGTWNPIRDRIILEFAYVGYESDLDRRRYTIYDNPEYLQTKLLILDVPMRLK